MNTSHHCTIKFGPAISGEDQGRLLLAWEKLSREMGIRAELFKETKADDSKLRIMMTPAERKKL